MAKNHMSGGFFTATLTAGVMALLIPAVKDTGGREEIITDLSAQACSFNSSQRYGEGFPGDSVNHSIFPVESLL